MKNEYKIVIEMIILFIEALMIYYYRKEKRVDSLIYHSMFFMLVLTFLLQRLFF